MLLGGPHAAAFMEAMARFGMDLTDFSPEIGRAYSFARSLGFPQINVDLIAGMMGDDDESWRACIQKTLDLSPDSITVYQMELPFNTTISKNLLTGGDAAGAQGAVAHWSTKRRWVKEAFEALDRLRALLVGAGHRVAEIHENFGDPGHANTADAHEVDVAVALIHGRPARC